MLVCHNKEHSDKHLASYGIHNYIRIIVYKFYNFPFESPLVFGDTTSIISPKTNLWDKISNPAHTDLIIKIPFKEPCNDLA